MFDVEKVDLLVPGIPVPCVQSPCFSDGRIAAWALPTSSGGGEVTAPGISRVAH